MNTAQMPVQFPYHPSSPLWDPDSAPWDADSIGVGLPSPIDYSSLVPPPLAPRNKKRASLSGPPQRYFNAKRASSGHPPAYRNRSNRASEIPEQLELERIEYEDHSTHDDNDIHKYERFSCPPRAKFNHISEADSKPLDIPVCRSPSPISPPTTDLNIREPWSWSGLEAEPEAEAEPKNRAADDFTVKRKPTPPAFEMGKSMPYMDIEKHHPAFIGLGETDLDTEHNKLAAITINVCSRGSDSTWSSKPSSDMDQRRAVIMGPSLESFQGRTSKRPRSLNFFKRIGLSRPRRSTD